MRFIALGTIVILALAGGCAGTYKSALENSEKTQVLLVKKKESVVHSDSNQYRIYTDKGVYEVSDSLFYWNWRAGDRYNELEEGHKYRCLQAGWRVGFFSMFPNLIECENVS